MKKLLLVALSVAMGSLVLTGVARAHHGDANRYNEDVVTITGTVVELQMINPHSIIVLDVDESGKKVRWQAELGGPQQLARQFGWSKSTIKSGDKITITGRRAKSGAPYMNLTERANIVMADTGKELFRTANYGQPAGAPAEPAPAAGRGRGGAPTNQ
jgi:hypothetical protein